MHPPIIQRVDPRAARYVELLVEFGHLDPPAAQEVLMMAAESWAGTDRIPLSFIRRIASAMVVAPDAPVDDGKDLLSVDWPLLFY